MKRLLSRIRTYSNNQTKARIVTPKNKYHASDRWLLASILFLSLFGLLMVYDSSVAIAIRDFKDQYHFVRDQMRWFLIGFSLLMVCSRIDYHRWKHIVVPFLFISVGLLLAVFVPGIGVKALGASRWIRIGSFIIQPAEIAKLSVIFYLASWFSNPEKDRLLSFVVFLSMIVGLIVIEPDIGTALIVISIALSLYFISGAPVSHFLMLLPILILAIAVLSVVSPYRLKRITTFIHPESDPLGASYQIRQVTLALGSGGLFGIGIGRSRQKYEYLPEANTDSIFAIIGEELGYAGSVAIIMVYLFILWRGFRIAKHTSDLFGAYLAYGVSFWFGIQACLNLSAIAALVPLTGVPLPLISYGGSSLIILMISLGIVLNISRSTV